jgi:RimJ/RimL family protein N-acetyltransferase
MEASDGDRLVRFHHTLSTESTYLRFFAVHPELSADELHRFTHVDHKDREAIVATIDDEIVGVARFDRLDGGTDAEVAFVVADRWQGRGLGTLLFESLAARAREVHITRFVADTLPHNTPMLRVFQDAGLPTKTERRDGVIHLVIPLTEGNER